MASIPTQPSAPFIEILVGEPEIRHERRPNFYFWRAMRVFTCPWRHPAAASLSTIFVLLTILWLLPFVIANPVESDLSSEEVLTLGMLTSSQERQTSSNKEPSAPGNSEPPEQPDKGTPKLDLSLEKTTLAIDNETVTEAVTIPTEQTNDLEQPSKDSNRTPNDTNLLKELSSNGTSRPDNQEPNTLSNITQVSQNENSNLPNSNGVTVEEDKSGDSSPDIVPNQSTTTQASELMTNQIQKKTTGEERGNMTKTAINTNIANPPSTVAPAESDEYDYESEEATQKPTTAEPGVQIIWAPEVEVNTAIRYANRSHNQPQFTQSNKSEEYEQHFGLVDNSEYVPINFLPDGTRRKGNKTRQPRVPIEWPDEAWRVRAASVGVELGNIGRAYSFDDAYLQIITVRYQIFENKGSIFTQLRRFCTGYSTADWMADAGLNETEAAKVNLMFLESCQNHQNLLIKLVQKEIDEFLPRSENDTQYTGDAGNAFSSMLPAASGKRRRNKREPITIMAIIGIIALVTAIVTLVTSTAIAHVRINNVQAKVEKLAKEAVTRDLESVSLREELMGLLIVDKAFKAQTKDALTKMRDSQELFGRELALAFARLRGKGNQMMQNQVYLNLVESLEKTVLASNLVSAVRQRKADYERALVSLRDGRLPSSIVSFEKLRTLLNEVEEQLPEHVSLGIPKTELSTYYILKLAAYSAENNFLYIRFYIPLNTRGNTPGYTKLMLPRTRQFPTPPTFRRQIEKSKRGSADFLRLSVSKAWAFIREGKQVRETDLALFDCQAAGISQICQTFAPRALDNPTGCLAFLNTGTISGYDRECEIKMSDNDYYVPIEVSPGKYEAHSVKGKSYVLFCTHGETDGVYLPIDNSNRTTTTISVPDGCVVKLGTGKNAAYLYPAQALVSHSTIKVSTPVVDLGLTYNVTFPREPEVVFDFEGAVPNMKFTYDEDIITKTVDKWSKDKEIIQARIVNNLDGVVGIALTRSSVVSYLQLFCDSIHCILIYTMLFALVRGGLLLPMAPIIIARPVRADPFQDIGNAFADYMPDLSSFDLWSSAVFPYAEIIKLAISSIAIVLAIYFSFCRKLYLSSHIGIIGPKGKFRFWITLNFMITRVTFTGLHRQRIQIRLPITAEVPTESRTVVAMQPTQLFYITKECFRTIEDIETRSEFKSGHFSAGFLTPIEFAVASVRWKGDAPFQFHLPASGAMTVSCCGDPAALDSTNN